MKGKMNERLELLLTSIFEDDKYYDNIELINYLSKSFAKKKLPMSLPNQLFMELTTLDQLTEVQLIWLVQKLYDYEEKGKKLFNELNPENFFSSAKVRDAFEYVGEDEVVDRIVLKNVDQISDTQFISSFVSVKDIALYKKNGLFNYDFSTQREAKLRPIGTQGQYAKEININQESVGAIGEIILKNQFRPNMITLNVPIFENKIPDLVYDKKERTLTITPHYNTQEDNLTLVNVVDGFHRVTSCEYAYDKAKEIGKTLTDGFIFSINLMTPEEARNHFKRENTFNIVSKEHLKTFEVSDESKFVDALVEWTEDGKENIFKGKVCKMYEELKITNSYTWMQPLMDALKLTDFKYSNVLQHKYIIPKIVDFTTLLISNIHDYYFAKKDIDELETFKQLRENTELLSPNIFIGYIAIANKISKVDQIPSYVEEMTQVLMSDKVKEDLKEMGLKNKHYSANKIYNYFDELI